MGKIKGWEKVQDDNVRLRYGNGEKRFILGHRGKHHSNWITLVDKTVFHSGIKRQGEKTFTNKTKAKKYMIDFMRANPNG